MQIIRVRIALLSPGHPDVVAGKLVAIYESVQA
jgi:hypothetical protein